MPDLWFYGILDFLKKGRGSSTRKEKVVDVTAIAIHSTENRGHIRDSLGVGLWWLVKNGKWITVLRSQLYGLKNHSKWLKNYPSNLGTLNCIDTVRAAASQCRRLYRIRSVSRIYISSRCVGDRIYLFGLRVISNGVWAMIFMPFCIHHCIFSQLARF